MSIPITTLIPLAATTLEGHSSSYLLDRTNHSNTQEYTTITNYDQHFFPTGTLMLFQQQTAPTGWTRQTTHNNKSLRVVNGTTWSGSGGTIAFTTVFGSGKTTGSHSLSEAEMPSHTHTGTTDTDGAHTHNMYYSNGATNQHDLFTYNTHSYSTNSKSDAMQSGGDHTHTLTTDSTGGDGTHTHTLSLDLHYVDVIIAAKD